MGTNKMKTRGFVVIEHYETTLFLSRSGDWTTSLSVNDVKIFGYGSVDSLRLPDTLSGITPFNEGEVGREGNVWFDDNGIVARVRFVESLRA